MRLDELLENARPQIIAFDVIRELEQSPDIVSVEEHVIAGPYWFGAENDPFSPFDAPTEKAVSDPNEV
jgi:hypothetical protein